jgi:type VI secretion system TssD-like protein
MSFKAELQVEGKTFALRSCYWVIYREKEVRGRPTSPPRWCAVVTFDASDDTTITNWMIDPHKQIDGKILLYKIDEDAKLKEITFNKAWCLHMEDKFLFDQFNASTSITITGPELHIGSSILNMG